jgi:hypothetical protein
VNKWYEQNKVNLKHDERIRLSSILIMAPQQDLGQMKSVRTQIKEANPKMSDKDLDAATATFNTQAQNRALILLGEAKANKVDFAKLANENTEDIMARSSKNGGDMGWKERGQLVPDFANAIWKVAPGTVFPQLLKTGEGFRIVKLTGHETPGVASLADVREAIEQKLKQDKTAAEVNKWIASQQSKEKIEFAPRFVALAKDKTKTH